MRRFQTARFTRFIALGLFFGISFLAWQRAAGAAAPALSGWFAGLRALVRFAPAQGGPARTVISTIAGGGLTVSAPVRSAPMILPVAVALDPLGRGYYVVDENNGASLVRFVNTSTAPVTLAGATIRPNEIGLIAGGAATGEGTAAREIDLSLVTGIAVDPSGSAVYVTTPQVNAIRAINVSAQNFTVLNQTIAPGQVKAIINIQRLDVRGLAVSPTREFFYISTIPNSPARAVYKFDATGESLYAGGGTPSTGNGDGFAAAAARLVAPMGIVLDTAGNLLIAEGGDTRATPGAVRKVDTTGTISTLAGNLEFPTGLALGPNNSVFVALGNAQRIVKITASGQKTFIAGTPDFTACDQFGNPTCGDGGPALAASLNLPGSTEQRGITLAADASGVYLPDTTFRRVRYINVTGGTVSIAGVPVGAAQINSVVGSGDEAPYDAIPATVTELSGPTGLAADASGNLFIADTLADPVSYIRFVNRTAAPITLFANTEWAITVQPGHIATLNHEAGEPSSDDRITRAVFASPQAMIVVPNGVYIVDSQYGALVRPQGSLNGRRSGHVRFLNTSNANVTIYPQGGAASVVVPPGTIKDIAGRNGQAFTGFIGDGAPATEAIIFPADIARGADGTLYIADQGNNLIRRINPATGIITSVQGPLADGTIGPFPTNGAVGLDISADGRLYLADTQANRILRQTAAGSTNFAVIADASRGINRPRDLLVDAATGQVFVVNSNTHQILRITAPTDALGTAVVVAGTGARGFSGDGGPGKFAKLDLPTPTTAINDVQVTANIIRLPGGEIAFTDTNNNRIRQLVELPNVAPVLAALSNRSIDEGATAAIDITATDANGDPLTLSATGLPSFATFTDNGDGTARLQLAPGFSNAGSYTISISATDGDATDTKSFTLTVNDVNRPPTVSAAAIPATFEANAPAGRSGVALSGAANDSDGDALSYKWFDGAAQIADAANAQVTLAIGNHSIFLLVTDARGASASSTPQSVSVRDTTPPTISNVPADVTVAATSAAGATVNYALPTATDIVDGSVAVTADKASGSLFPIGETIVKFTASDARGNAASAQFKVTVTPAGPTPTPTPTPGAGTPASYTISTVAGTGGYGNDGNYGPAASATFRSISNLVRDAQGLLIVDPQGRSLRRIDAQGVIRPVAGNGANGNTGDGGPAIYASFGAPAGVAADAQGNLYVSDANFHRIRRITADGKIAHFAGSSTGVSGSLGDNGTAASARLNRPGAMVVVNGVLYFADSGNGRIRVINLATNIITTIAGNGFIGFGGDGGPATAAALNNPSGLAADAAGNLFIADRGNQRIRRIDAATRVINTIAGDGNAGFAGDGAAATAAQLNQPTDVAVDATGNVYFVDQFNHRTRRVTFNSGIGTIQTIAGTGVGAYGGDGGPALQAQLNYPAGIEVEADGSILVGDSGNLRLRKLTPVANPTPTPTPTATPTPTPTPTPNRIPVITSGGSNQTMTTGQTLDLPLVATDADGDPVSFTLLNAPGFASILNANPQARTATLRLAPTQAGTFTGIQVRADDGRGGTAVGAAFSVTVTAPPSNLCFADVPVTQWKGEYFNNRFLDGAPAMVRNDGESSLNFDFGLGGPSDSCGLGVDNFSVRWTRTLNLTGGVYRFSVFSDDGVRLFIDGERKLDSWYDRPEVHEDVDVTLTSGLHTVRMEYYENGGNASARLFINPLNSAPVVARLTDQTVRRGQTLDVPLSATDADGDPVTFRLLVRGSYDVLDVFQFATIVNANPAARTATLRIAPPVDANPAGYPVLIQANDGRGGTASSLPFTITVTSVAPPQNRPPTAVAAALPASINAPDSSGATVHLDGSASSDPDGDTLVFTWTDNGSVIANGAVTDVKLGVGAHAIALAVSDGRGGTNTSAVQSVTVNPPAPPAAALSITSVSPANARRGSTVTLTVTGTGFEPGASVVVNGGGLTATTTYVSATQLSVRLVIPSAALATTRSMTVTNPGGTSVTRTGAFAVLP